MGQPVGVSTKAANQEQGISKNHHPRDRPDSLSDDLTVALHAQKSARTCVRTHPCARPLDGLLRDGLHRLRHLRGHRPPPEGHAGELGAGRLRPGKVVGDVVDVGVGARVVAPGDAGQRGDEAEGPLLQAVRVGGDGDVYALRLQTAHMEESVASGAPPKLPPPRRIVELRAEAMARDAYSLMICL